MMKNSMEMFTEEEGSWVGCSVGWEVGPKVGCRVGRLVLGEGIRGLKETTAKSFFHGWPCTLCGMRTTMKPLNTIALNSSSRA